MTSCLGRTRLSMFCSSVRDLKVDAVDEAALEAIELAGLEVLVDKVGSDEVASEEAV